MLMICLKSWECSIMPDWLLIWKQYNDELVLVMTNTGSRCFLETNENGMESAAIHSSEVHEVDSKTYLQ